MSAGIRCVALSGGIGGAKLALGLSLEMAPEALMVVANTGDDFEHLGLSISPDVDTLTYTLGGVANAETGWGRAGETWSFMEALGEIGGETWFNLGDKDLALHVERTRRLAAGETLSAITADIASRFAIAATIVPMSDDAVRTVVETRSDGTIEFQDYFVRRQAAPAIAGLTYAGADKARPYPEFLAALAAQALEAVIVCPSNPLISIGPILAVPGIRDALAACSAPVIAISPIVGGRALKGPTGKMMQDLGMDCSAEAVADHYGDLLDGFVIDIEDDALADRIGDSLPVCVTRTVMTDLDDRRQLARTALDFASTLRLDPSSSKASTA
jgi:LPPG:FO 2-phospho-L-lactate transferase